MANFSNKTHKITQLKMGGKIMKQYKPGEVCQEAGYYLAYDEDGSCGGKVYLENGQRFPATQHSGSYYEKEN